MKPPPSVISSWTSGFIVLFLSMSWSSATFGQAQDTDAQARAHFRSGLAYFETGDYEDAIREFERSHELSGYAVILFNISGAYERLGEWPKAVEYLERYLAEEKELPNRGALSRRVERLRERMKRRSTAQGRSGSVRAEEVAQEDSEASQLERDSVRETPSPAVEDDAAVEEDAQLAASAETEEGSTAVPKKAPRKRIPLTAVASFIVAGVGAAGVGVFGGLALAADRSLSAMPCAETGTCDPARTQTLRRWTLLSDISLGVAVVAAGTGAVLALVGGRKRETAQGSQSSLRVSGWLTDRSAGAALRGAF